MLLAGLPAVQAPPVPLGIVLTSFDPGGTERQMTELIGRLDRGRFDVHVACFRREGHWLPRVEAAARSVTEFPIRGFRSPATASQLLRFARWCGERRLAVVQACDFYANVFALPGAALARVPVRIGARRDLVLPGRSPGQHRLQRWAYRSAHRIVANSQAAAAQVIAEGVPQSRVSVIPNGIDVARYAAPRPSRPPDARTVTTIANLRPEKGHDVLLDAAAQVVRSHPDVRFQFVGDGPMRASLEEQVQRRGLASQVAFLGHRDDVPELLARSALFVLPSRSEAFPNGLLEAMAAGVPSIASGVGGVLELVQHQRNGMLVPVGDAPALAAAIIALLDAPQTADRLATSGRQTIASRYSFERMVGEFEELYLSELAGSRFPIHALYAR